MRKIFTALLFIVSVFSCTQRENILLIPEEGKIYASIQGCEIGETKVELNNYVETVWSSGDVIRTFVPGKTSDYVFDGQTGDRSGSFTLKQDYEGCEGLTEGAYALYPADLYMGCSTGSEFKLHTNLKNVQEYKKDSFAEGVNVMVGTSSDQINYTFGNVFGYLRMSLTGNKTVDHITIKGNGFEDISGALSVWANDPSQWVWSFSGDIYDEITLECGEGGVQLSETEPTLFHIALPSMEFVLGITATIYFTDGSIYPQSTSKEIEIQQNHILPMAVINTSGTQWQIVGISHSGTTLGSPTFSALNDGVTSLSGVINYGDGNIIHIGDGAEYNYKDGEESHQVTAQVKDANTITFNSCIGVSKIDLSQF